jgi:hypothetical protein
MNSPMDMQTKIERAVRGQVEYLGTLFADARNVDGVWYYKGPLTGLFVRFLLQHKVKPAH